MPDTERSLSDILTLYADNSTGAISPQDLRDGIVSLACPAGEISYFSLTGTTVAIAAQSDGSTNMVLCAPGTALSGSEYEFDSPSAGRLRYTGVSTRMFHIACTISIAPAATNDVFVFGVFKNGTLLTGSRVLIPVATAADKHATALHVFTTLATNQYLELYVGNTTDADDVTIHTLNLFAMGMIM